MYELTIDIIVVYIYGSYIWKVDTLVRLHV